MCFSDDITLINDFIKTSYPDEDGSDKVEKKTTEDVVRDLLDEMLMNAILKDEDVAEKEEDVDDDEEDGVAPEKGNES